MNLIKSPFNIYDLLSYLSNGFILSIVIYFFYFNKENLIKIIIGKLTLSVSIILLVLISYIIGHLISLSSSSLFEKLIIKYLLGYPSYNFFTDKPIGFKIIKKIFGLYSYKSQYSIFVKKKINSKFKRIFNLNFKDVDNFNLCFHFVKENSPATYNRLLTFISIYGFCRNLSMNLLIIAIILIFNSYFTFGFIIIVLSYLFFLRYLKFFRQYGDEVYKTFIIL